jgi:hypothetical protein
MQSPSHATRERLVNHLMLLDARLAPKGLRDDARAQMVAVTDQVPDCHFGVRQFSLDQALDFSCVHGHWHRSP